MAKHVQPVSDSDDSGISTFGGVGLDFEFGHNEKTKPKRDHKLHWRRRKHRVYLQACERRDRLRAELGNECGECGARIGDMDSKGAPVLLCFDHGDNVRDWEPRKMNMMHRMRMYERDHKRGLIKLSCNECNGFDGAWHGKARARRHRRAM